MASWNLIAPEAFIALDGAEQRRLLTEWKSVGIDLMTRGRHHEVSALVDRIQTATRPAVDSLDAEGRVALLGILSLGIHACRELGDLRASHLACERVLALGEPRFDDLRDEGQSLVLQAHWLLTESWARRHAWHAACRSHLSACGVCEPRFGEMGPQARAQALQLFCGHGRYELVHDAVTGEMRGYERVRALGIPVFGELDATGQFAVLQALVLEALQHMNAGRDHLARDRFVEAGALGSPVFGNLNAMARACVLEALVRQPYLFGGSGDDPERAHCYRHAVELSVPLFADLNIVGRAWALRALVNLGIVEGQQGQHGRTAELRFYDQAIALGEPCFGSLDAFGRRHVLQALVNKGTSHIESEPDTALESYDIAIQLGRATFREIDELGQRQVLTAVHNRMAIHAMQGDRSRCDADEEIALELAEPVFAMLDIKSQVDLVRAVVRVSRYKRPGVEARRMPGARILRCADMVHLRTWDKAAFGGRPYRIEEGGFLARDADWLLRSLNGDHESLVQDTLDEARVWLGFWGGDGYSVDHPQHRQALRRLSQSLVVHDWRMQAAPAMVPWELALGLLELDEARRRARAEAQLAWERSLGERGPAPISPSAVLDHGRLRGWRWRWRHRHDLRRLQQQLEAAGCIDVDGQLRGLVTAAAAAVAAAARRQSGWVNEMTSAGQALLGALRAGVATPDVRLWWERRPWSSAEFDDLCRGLHVDRVRRADGGMVTFASWFYGLGHARATPVTLAQGQEALDPVYAEVMGALLRGETGPLQQQLELAWWAVRAESAPSASVPARLEALLSRYGVTDAASVASDALLFADAEVSVRGAVQRWIEGILSQRGVSLAAALGQVLDQLIPDLALAPTVEAGLSKLLHECRQADLGQACTASAAWTPLEAGRFALTALTPVPGARASQPAVSVEPLRSALTAGILAFRARSRRVAAGDEDTYVSVAQSGLTHAHYDSLTEILEGLGHRLAVPPMRDCAARLAASDRLVQVWFGADHRLQALELRSDGSALIIDLGPALSAKAWRPTLKRFERLQPYPGQFDAFIDIASAAWEALVDRDGPAMALISWLIRGRPGADTTVKRTIFIPDASLGGLPWLALASASHLAGEGHWQPGSLQLEVSVSAWLSAAQGKPAGARTGPVSDCARVLVEPDAYGDAEAKVAASALGSGVLRTSHASSLDAFAALAHPEPKHWALHGVFDSSNPMNSGLQFNERVRIPASWLRMGRVRGDVSLAVCEALLSGPSHASPWIGPAGIGAVLRAAGASTVTGPLWSIAKLAALNFYAYWFEERKSLSPLHALSAAHDRLRTAGWDESVERTKSLAPDLDADAVSYFRQVRDMGLRGPFDHPGLWAAFSVIGGEVGYPVDRSTAAVRS